jgi:PAS domain S-box-containing protein
MLSDESRVLVQPIDNQTIAGYAMLTDIYGHPALILRTDMPRHIYAQGRTAIAYFMGMTLALGLLVGYVLLVLLEKTVLTKAQMGAVLEHSSDVIILAQTDGTIEGINPAFKRLFTSANSQPSTQSLFTLFGADFIPTLTDALHAVVERREHRQIDVTVQNGDHKVSANMALSPIQNGTHAVSGVLCSLRDLTVHKRLEEQLRKMLARELEVNELKSRLIATVSHELRTPLATIQLAGEALEQYRDQMTNEQKQERLNRIKSGIQQMTNLLEDLLTLSRAESGKLKLEPTPFDLVTFCQGVVDTIHASVKNTLTIVFTNQGTCGEVYMDQRLLRLITSNLLANAVKYSSPDSTVYFSLRCKREESVLQIRDEGIGIPPEDQVRLFEPFFRAANARAIPGTGLGLAIVKQAVEVQGGTIQFESQVGNGTTFTVTLPKSALAANVVGATNIPAQP